MPCSWEGDIILPRHHKLNGIPTYGLSIIIKGVATHDDLLMARMRTITYRPRSSAVSGSCAWNDLLPTLRASPSTLGQFQSTLNTILFCSAYGT